MGPWAGHGDQWSGSGSRRGQDPRSKAGKRREVALWGGTARAEVVALSWRGVRDTRRSGSLSRMSSLEPQRGCELHTQLPSKADITLPSGGRRKPLPSVVWIRTQTWGSFSSCVLPDHDRPGCEHLGQQRERRSVPEEATRGTGWQRPLLEGAHPQRGEAGGGHQVTSGRPGPVERQPVLAVRGQGGLLRSGFSLFFKFIF